MIDILTDAGAKVIGYTAFFFEPQRDPDSNELKITDFGIARITDSSKTKTGVVLGTPS